MARIPAGTGDVLLKVEFVPQIGYLVVTPREGHSTSPLAALPHYELFFNTEAGWCRLCTSLTSAKDYDYFKSDTMRKLDADVGDLHGMICGICPFT